jgi:hypothetical protein
MYDGIKQMRVICPHNQIQDPFCKVLVESKVALFALEPGG